MSYNLLRKDLGNTADNSVIHTSTFKPANQTAGSMVQKFLYEICIKCWHFIILKDTLRCGHSPFEKVILEAKMLQGKAKQWAQI